MCHITVIHSVAYLSFQQCKISYQYAAQLLNEQGNTQGADNITEDSLAYLRKEREFKNYLLTELPRGDWAHTILRQFLFSNYQYQLMQQLKENADTQIAAIAEKSFKEITYHLRWSAEWVIRLGDGTSESKARIEKAIAEQWPYTGEMFFAADYENQMGIEPAAMQGRWMEKVKEVF